MSDEPKLDLLSEVTNWTEEDEVNAQRIFKDIGTDHAGKWANVWSVHPASGGPFGGRNNALVALIGFLRAKDVPYEPGLEIIAVWNENHCDPPQAESVWREVASRAWAEWKAGRPIADEEPDPPPTEEGDYESLSVPEIYQHVDPVMLVEGLLEDGAINYICGPPGHGKTWLALWLCKCLTPAGPADILDNFLDIAGSLAPKTVLYVDAENGVGRIKQRMKALDFSEGCTTFRLFKGRKLRLDNPKDLKKLLKLCAKLGVTFIVFDSLRRFHSFDENKSEQMSLLGDILRDFFVAKGITVLALHHDVKNGAMVADQDRTRGSGDITGGAECVLGLMKDRETGVYMVSRRKVRGAPDDGPPIPFALVPGGEDGRVGVSVSAAREKMKEKQEAKDAEKQSTRRKG